jgi:hypothetical protein
MISQSITCDIAGYHVISRDCDNTSVSTVENWSGTRINAVTLPLGPPTK